MKTIITTEIENSILQWNDTSASNGDFGARSFLIHDKEFGHLHPDGTLDIVFGKQLTRELLDKGLVQKHLFVPDAAITYKITNAEKVPFALSLLSFSYLINAMRHHIISPNELETELGKLPQSLATIYPKQP